MNKFYQLALLLFVCMGGAAFVEAMSEPIERSLTIYRESGYGGEYFSTFNENDVEDAGLAMVTEYRIIELSEGNNSVVIDNIVDGIVPQTLDLSDLKEKLKESNFTFNLLVPSNLLFHSLNQSVFLVRTNSVTGKLEQHPAIIRSVSERIVLEIDGKLEMLGCHGSKEKIVFPKIPDELVSSPELRLDIHSKIEQKIKVKLTYLVRGIQWKANHNVYLDFSSKTFDLQSWITLQNSRSTSFRDIQVQVVAGRLATDGSTYPPQKQLHLVNSDCWPLTTRVERFYSQGDEAVEEVVVTGIKASLAKQEELGDYKLYVFPHRTNIEPKQAKQIMFLNQEKIPFSIEYEFSFAFESLLDEYDNERLQFASANIVASNTKNHNLGVPIPAGDVEFFERSQLAKILHHDEYQYEEKDVPVDALVNWTLGTDANITVFKSSISYEGKEESPTVNIKLLLSNNHSRNVWINVRQLEFDSYDVKKVISENPKGFFKNGLYNWKLNLPPNSTTSLNAKLELLDKYD